MDQVPLKLLVDFIWNLVDYVLSDKQQKLKYYLYGFPLNFLLDRI